MSATSHRRAVFFALGLVLESGRAHASASNVWRRAANPRAAAREDAVSAATAEHESYIRAARVRAEAAVEHLARAHAAAKSGDLAGSTDPLARYIVARLELASFELDRDVERLERAGAHLRFVTIASERAARIAPRSEAAAHEFRSLVLYDRAVVHAHRAERRQEIAAYDDALALETHPLRRAVLLANQAEARLSLGDVSRAIRGYRTSLGALPLVAVGAVGVTTLWGLGVALDRSGDLDAALSSIALARSYDSGDLALRGDGWFFVPAYDVHYYAALGHWQRARALAEPGAKHEALGRVADELRAYLAKAPPDERWRPLAEVRLAQCERERALPR